MSNSIRDELLKLSTAERLELVEELWDSIAAEREREPFPLSDEQRDELDRRLRELDEHPNRARPWSEVRERLWSRRRD
jgi:putative addiction module component (TIGR02574 family)